MVVIEMKNKEQFTFQRITKQSKHSSYESFDKACCKKKGKRVDCKQIRDMKRFTGEM